MCGALRGSCLSEEAENYSLPLFHLCLTAALPRFKSPKLLYFSSRTCVFGFKGPVADEYLLKKTKMLIEKKKEITHFL